MSAAVYVASGDEERWAGGEEYATRAEAVEQAPADLDLEPGQRFWTGVKVPQATSHLVSPGMADDLAARVAERACEDVDLDFCLYWLNMDAGERERLAALLSGAVEAFIAEHPRHRPSWFRVASVEEHAAPAEAPR